MWSLTNSVCTSPKGHRSLPAIALLVCLAALCLGAMAQAQDGDLRAPSSAVAGQPASIATTGGGTATFYLIGPSIALKRDVKVGQDIPLAGKELESAGKYLAVLCSGSCRSVAFFVSPAKATNLIFLVHPSRAPVGENNIVSGVALPFDEFRNFVMTPANVNFQLSAGESKSASHQMSTQNGAAWFRLSSGRSAGPLQLTASIGSISVRRVVEQVASDPCRLQIKGYRDDKGFVVETEPVRDCSGNPVPDGTIVTFTARDATGTDTVDAPVKKGIARVQMEGSGPVTISAASGVVMGNELRLGPK